MSGDFSRRLAGDEKLSYCNAANMNVTAVVDGSDGSVLERYAYDPYGKVTVLNGENGADPDVDGSTVNEWDEDADNASDVANEILYCGYRFDPLAGLYHVRRRPYHCTLARWLSKNPAEYEDGLNVYAYANLRPVAHVDPFGLWTAEATLDLYRTTYGNARYRKLLMALAGGLRIEGKCMLSHDWWVEGRDEEATLYINIWSGLWDAERSDENAAAQLNEALAKHFGIGDTSTLYKVGRVTKGVGKVVAGGLLPLGGRSPLRVPVE